MNMLRFSSSSVLIVKAANLLLLLLFIWMTVQFIWSFWPQSSSTASRPVTGDSSEIAFDLNKVLASSLFGEAGKPVETSQQISAPVTRLNLKLRGVFASDDEYASAMIEHNRKQDVYRLGASLPGATGLSLYKVLSDRIIMSRNGKYETLYIQDFDGSTPSPQTRQPTIISEPAVVEVDDQSDSFDDSEDRNIIDKRSDKRVTEELLKLRENLSDPAALSELLTISPVQTDDGFEGFRLSPGKNRALFGRLGLRRNDIVKAVNDISLDDPTSVFNITEQLSTADELKLTIMRGDREMELYLSAAQNF